MKSRRARSPRSPIVFMVIGVLAITLRAAKDDPWVLCAIPLVIGLVHLYERVGRARAVRARTPDAGDNPAWLGRLLPYSLWIWPDLPKRWWLLHDEGLSVRLEVGADGITIIRRNLMGRSTDQFVFVPWADVVGARSRDRGHRGPSGTTFTTLRQTDITIDIVGASADESALPAAQPADSEGTGVRAEMDEQTRAIVTGLAGRECPDWRPGTAPLVLVTALPDGLVDLVVARAAAGG